MCLGLRPTVLGPRGPPLLRGLLDITKREIHLLNRNLPLCVFELVRKCLLCLRIQGGVSRGGSVLDIASSSSDQAGGCRGRPAQASGRSTQTYLSQGTKKTHDR